MNKFENFLATCGGRQRAMVYFIVFVVGAFLISQIAYPIQLEVDGLNSSIATVESNMAKDKTARTKVLIASKEKELAILKDRVEKQKEEISFLVSNLYKLRFAFFNEKEFAQSLDDILKKSVNNNLKIDYVKNVEFKLDAPKELLGQKKRLEIAGQGSYKEVVEFVGFIENLEALLKFTKITLVSDKDAVKFTLVLDIYGIGL
ncbi:MAG: hypothetical protein PHN38_09155 [Sulfurospirillaceae bacterium]|nr:hypothetical protein [Sulfurospirillaceae bacterium]MDD3463792.1 hypothetical protein [Sulfurospirillaceae bacterium]